MQENTLNLLGVAAALGSAASWALGAILFNIIGERLSPFGTTLAKGAISVIQLGIVVLFLGVQPIGVTPLALLILSGIIGIAMGDTFFFKALQDLGPVSMIVLMMVGQVFTSALGVIILGEMPPLLAWVGMAIVLTGVAIVLRADSTEGAASKTRTRGLVYGLIAVLCMSVSIIIAKKPLHDVPTIQATFIRMTSGTLGVFLVGAWLDQLRGWISPLKDAKFMARFVLAVCVVTFGGFWLSLVAVKNLNVAIASTLNATEPIFIIPLAYFMLRKPVSLSAVLGALTTTLGIVFVCLSELSKATH